MDLVLQGDNFIPLVLDLLNELLFSDSLFDESALIQLDKLLEVRTLAIRLLGKFEQAQVLILFNLDASLSVFYFLLYLGKVNGRLSMLKIL